MLSSAGSVVLRLGAWSYLPDFAARKILSVYYQALISRGGTPPQPSTQRWQTHYRIAYSLSVLGFLSYNLFEAARSTPTNFFQLLGVSPDADETTLRSAYRAFAKRYHPDRAGPASEPMFMAVRNAYEALKDPMKRFAYERFGPDALDWRNCSMPMDYLKQGILQSSGFYIVSGVILVVMSISMGRSPVTFWRYMLLLTLFACELCLTAGPRSFGLLGLLFPDRVAFQHVLFLHQLFVFLSVALSRVVPVIFPEKATIRPEDPHTYGPWIQRLESLEKLADAEALRLLHLELHAMSSESTTGLRNSNGNGAAVTFETVPPCDPPSDVLGKLTQEMEDIVVEQRIRAEPPLRALWDVAVRRERERVSPIQLSDEDSVREAGSSGVDANTSKGITIPSLPSPSPSVSPEQRPVELLAREEEHDVDADADDGSKTPKEGSGSLMISPVLPASELDGPRARANTNGRPFIRVVEQ